MLVVEDLGVEAASYVRRYLEANRAFGKQLGELLLARFDVERGSVWAFLPGALPDDRRAALTNFEAGGIFRRHGQGWRQDVNAWVARTVGQTPHLLCAEDALARPTDPFVAKLESRIFFCQESVFDCVELPTDGDVSHQFRGATWDPEIAILTARPPSAPMNRAAISLAALAALVDRTVAVGIGAWDDEAAIFWEPAKSR